MTMKIAGTRRCRRRAARLHHPARARASGSMRISLRPAHRHLAEVRERPLKVELLRRIRQN